MTDLIATATHNLIEQGSIGLTADRLRYTITQAASCEHRLATYQIQSNGPQLHITITILNLPNDEIDLFLDHAVKRIDTRLKRLDVANKNCHWLLHVEKNHFSTPITVAHFDFEGTTLVYVTHPVPTSHCPITSNDNNAYGQNVA